MIQTESCTPDCKRDQQPRKYEISYLSVVLIIYFHAAGLYGAYLCVTEAKWITLIYTCSTFFLASVGVVVGAHKLWSHRAFKATRPLEIFLMLCQSMAFQFTVYKWVSYAIGAPAPGPCTGVSTFKAKLHRLHHQHSDTASDPHDASRGLFYSHIGWLMVRRPGGTLTFTAIEDIETNPVLNFQRRHANWLLPIAAFIIPTVIPLLWSEDLSTSWHMNQLRFIINLNLACSVNSFSHTWGNRPYDRRLKARESWPIILLTLGEGYHNYHHAFPYDYRASEKGWPNMMARVVDVCAKVGLAYGLREASEKNVRLRREMRGDGTLE